MNHLQDFSASTAGVHADPNYLVCDRNGVAVTTFHPAGAPFGTGWSASMLPDDFDADGRQELLLDYQYGPAPGGDVFYVYECNSPVSVGTGGEPRPLELSARARRSNRTLPRRLPPHWA